MRVATVNAPAPIATLDRVKSLELRVADLEAQVAELMELKTANPRRVFMTDVVKWRLAGALPDLQRRTRNYVTAKTVAEHFGFPLDTTRIGIRKAIEAGKVRTERVRGRHEWLVLLPGQSIPRELPLSKNHSDILMELRRIAVEGAVTMSNNELSRILGRSPNTVWYALQRLVLSGHLSVLKRGERWKPSTYFIPSGCKMDEDEPLKVGDLVHNTESREERVLGPATLLAIDPDCDCLRGAAWIRYGGDHHRYRSVDLCDLIKAEP